MKNIHFLEYKNNTEICRDRRRFGDSLSYTYLEERAARLFCRLCLPA
jgi:hypothetical protein